ncbi:MAG: hypothetical protein ACKOYJ_12430, partial [Planctomycetia bacterium]
SSIAVADMGTFSSGRISNARALDGRAEIIVGSGAGIAPSVLVYDLSGSPAVVDRLSPFSRAFTSGISVSVGRFNADIIPDIMVASARNGNSVVEIYDGSVSAPANTLLARQAAFATIGKVNAAVFATMADVNNNGIIDDGEIFTTQGDGGANSGIKRLTRAGGVQSTVTGSPLSPLRIVSSTRRPQ